MIKIKNNLIFTALLTISLIIFLGFLGIASADSDDYWENEYRGSYGYDDDDDDDRYDYDDDDDDYGYDDDDYEWVTKEHDDEEFEYRYYKDENFQDTDNDSIYDQYDVYPEVNDLIFAIDSDLDGIVDGEDLYPGEDDFAFLVSDVNQNGIVDDLENIISNLIK